MHKPFLFLFLLLLILPIVNASSFTDSFSDYGKDTNGDALFNYLTIEAGASLTQADNYIIFGRLKDSQGNFIEYEDCKTLPVGNYNFILDFNGRKIYKNKVDGPYYLKYIELSTISDCSSRDFPVYQDSLNDSYTTSFYSYKQFQKGNASIYCDSSPCIAPSSLIRSRDNLNTPEPNAPNTIDNCEDGTAGTYMEDESIESITVTSLNHSNFFKIGDSVRVDIQAYCYDSLDKLNFVYSNDIDNIQWQIKDTEKCINTDLNTFSTSFQLDNNPGNHAIRGVFGFGLPSNAICGEDTPNKDWADNDDIVINVKASEPQNQLILTKGWNLISLPKINNNDIDEIVNIFNNFEKIITLKNNKWYIYDKSTNSNLNELSEEHGFWIKMNENQSILIEEAAQQTSFELTKGWNLIGYPSIKENSIEQLFQDVIDDVELIYVYNNEFKSFNPENPSNIIIKPGTGIFIKIKDNTEWYFDGIYKKGQQLPKFNLILEDGWNLISIPLTSDKIISELFGSKTLYYLENNVWKQLGNNNRLNYSHAYWIKANESSVLIEGTEINNLNYNINQGWNLINYPLRENKDINTFFQNVMNNIESITTYENQEWKTYNPLKQQNSLTLLKPGKGIFIKAKNKAEWNFNGNKLVAT